MTKACSVALATLINGGVFFDGIATPGKPFVPYDLYTISLPSGLVLLYTTAPFPIAAPNTAIFSAPAIYGGSGGNVWFSGIVWQPFGIDSTANKATGHWKVGLDSDQWQIEIAPRPFAIISRAPYPDKIGSQPWLAAVANGALDNADIIISRAYFSGVPSYNPYGPSDFNSDFSPDFGGANPYWIGPKGNGIAPVGTLLIFRGITGEVDVSATSAIVTINDYKSILSQQMPRNLYMASCRNLFGDNRCGVSLAAFTQTGTASSASAPGQIIATAPIANPGGSDTYALGTLTMTSGANEGESQLVNGWDGAATFSLLRPFPYAISAGDTFSVYAGCNKSTGNCALFDNTANFRGDPFVPSPELTLG